MMKPGATVKPSLLIFTVLLKAATHKTSPKNVNHALCRKDNLPCGCRQKKCLKNDDDNVGKNCKESSKICGFFPNCPGSRDPFQELLFP